MSSWEKTILRRSSRWLSLALVISSGLIGDDGRKPRSQSELKRHCIDSGAHVSVGEVYWLYCSISFHTIVPICVVSIRFSGSRRMTYRDIPWRQISYSEKNRKPSCVYPLAGCVNIYIVSKRLTAIQINAKLPMP